jgi:hypothetical protein
MKRIFVALLVLLCSPLAFGQANTFSQTTLASAITTPSSTNATGTTVIQVTSATGVTAKTTAILVDAELMYIEQVNGTSLTVIRGANGTNGTTHDTTAIAWIGQRSWFQAMQEFGSCTLTTLFVHPHIDLKDHQIFQCINSVWVGNTIGPELTGYRTSGRFRDQVAVVGSTAYGSLGTSTTDTNGGLFCSDVFVARTRKVTGIATLNAGTTGSDNVLVILYDAGGNLVANSATGGVLTSGNNAFQEVSFTATLTINGPADYFICRQANGTTDNFRTIAASTFADVLTKNVTGGVFGTIPASITVPTTFTANVGPFGYIF